jgi:hypothetical protein
VETPATGFDQLNGTGVLEPQKIAVTTVGGLFARGGRARLHCCSASAASSRCSPPRSRGAWTGRGVEGARPARRDAGDRRARQHRPGGGACRRGVRHARHRHAPAGRQVPGVERVYAREDLHACAGAADVVVPAVAGTRDRALDRRCRAGGDAAACAADQRRPRHGGRRSGVAAALAAGGIAGAGLDVFVREPLPAESRCGRCPTC